MHTWVFDMSVLDFGFIIIKYILRKKIFLTLTENSKKKKKKGFQIHKKLMSSSVTLKDDINREKMCPFLIRVFVRNGEHLSDIDFIDPDKLPSKQMHIHTWLNASLNELKKLLSSVIIELNELKSYHNCILSFALVYPDKKGKMVVKQSGIVKIINNKQLYLDSINNENKNNDRDRDRNRDRDRDRDRDSNRNRDRNRERERMINNDDSDDDIFKDDGHKTLKSLKFEIGDFLDVSYKIQKPIKKQYYNNNNNNYNRYNKYNDNNFYRGRGHRGRYKNRNYYGNNSNNFNRDYKPNNNRGWNSRY